MQVGWNLYMVRQIEADEIQAIPAYAFAVTLNYSIEIQWGRRVSSAHFFVIWYNEWSISEQNLRPKANNDLSFLRRRRIPHLKKNQRHQSRQLLAIHKLTKEVQNY